MAEINTEPSEQLSSLVRRQRGFLVVAVCAAALCALGLVASLFIKSPAQAAAEIAPPPPSTLTAPVMFKVLEDTVTVRGDVVPSSSLPVSAAIGTDGSAPIVTALPKPSGSEIQAGDVIAQISGRPIIALPGAIPAYRDILPQTTGDDVTQLQNSLRDLGYFQKDSNGIFDADTKYAISALYAAKGIQPPNTQDFRPGEKTNLQAAKQAVISAQRKIAADQLTLAQANEPAAKASAILTLKNSREDLAIAQQNASEIEASSGVYLPLREHIFVPLFPSTMGKVNVSVGSSLASVQGPIMTINTGLPVIRALVSAGQKAGIRAQQSATTSDEIQQRSAPGKVSAIGEFTTPGAGSNTSDASQQEAQGGISGTGYPIIITPDAALDPSWLGKNVKVTILAAKSSQKVLTVPLSAVLSDSNGQSFVTVLDNSQNRQKVSVNTGMVAAGEVEVTPVNANALRADDKVVIG